MIYIKHHTILLLPAVVFNYMGRLFNSCDSRVLFKFCFLFLFLAIISCSKKPTSAADPNELWSFVVFSDVQQGYGIFSQQVKQICEIKPTPKLAICCGDIMLRSANEAEWLSFENYAKPLKEKMPLYLVRGNHEGNDYISELVLHKQSCFPDDCFYYSFTYNNSCFVILDSYKYQMENSIRGEQLDWLKETLCEAESDSQISNIFIMMHHPIFSKGQNAKAVFVNRDELHSLFRSTKKIKAVFSGHDHMFNLNVQDGIKYIICGGSGGDLHHGAGGDYYHFIKITFCNEGKITFKVIGILNEINEDFTI